MRRLILVLAFVVAACGSAATPSPSRTAPPSQSPTAAPSQTASEARPAVARLTLTPNWSEVELTEAGLREMSASLQDTNPEYASLLQQMLDAGAYKAFRFLAYRFEGIEATGTINILEVPSGGRSLDLLEQQYTDLLGDVPGVSGLKSERVTLPAGEAVLFTGDQSMVMADGSPFVISIGQYTLVMDDSMYQIGFGCHPEASAACLRDVEAMMQTLTIEP